jgi:hypothetical protein
MKTGITWVPTLGLLVVAGCGTSWQDYSSTTGKFTIQFPDKPKEEEESRFGVTRHTVVLKQNDRTYSVSYVDWTPEQLEKFDLDRFAEGSVEGAKGKKTGQESIKLGDYPGRDVRVDLPDGKELRNRIYLVKNRAYVVTVVGKKGFPSSGEAEKFFNSFKLTT